MLYATNRNRFEWLVVIDGVPLVHLPPYLSDRFHGLVAIPAPAVERPQLMVVYEALPGRIA